MKFTIVLFLIFLFLKGNVLLPVFTRDYLAPNSRVKETSLFLKAPADNPLSRSNAHLSKLHIQQILNIISQALDSIDKSNISSEGIPDAAKIGITKTGLPNGIFLLSHDIPLSNLSIFHRTYWERLFRLQGHLLTDLDWELIQYILRPVFELSKHDLEVPFEYLYYYSFRTIHHLQDEINGLDHLETSAPAENLLESMLSEITTWTPFAQQPMFEPFPEAKIFIHYLRVNKIGFNAHTAQLLSNFLITDLKRMDKKNSELIREYNDFIDVLRVKLRVMLNTPGLEFNIETIQDIIETYGVSREFLLYLLREELISRHTPNITTYSAETKADSVYWYNVLAGYFIILPEQDDYQLAKALFIHHVLLNPLHYDTSDWERLFSEYGFSLDRKVVDPDIIRQNEYLSRHVINDEMQRTLSVRRAIVVQEALRTKLLDSKDFNWETYLAKYSIVYDTETRVFVGTSMSKANAIRLRTFVRSVIATKIGAQILFEGKKILLEQSSDVPSTLTDENLTTSPSTVAEDDVDEVFGLDEAHETTQDGEEVKIEQWKIIFEQYGFLFNDEAIELIQQEYRALRTFYKRWSQFATESRHRHPNISAILPTGSKHDSIDLALLWHIITINLLAQNDQTHLETASMILASRIKDILTSLGDRLSSMPENEIYNHVLIELDRSDSEGNPIRGMVRLAFEQIQKSTLQISA